MSKNGLSSNMNIQHMSQMYDKIVSLLGSILEPPPLNQLGVPDYCRHMLRVLDEVKKMIEDLESSYRTMLHSYDTTMDEEF